MTVDFYLTFFIQLNAKILGQVRLRNMSNSEKNSVHFNFFAIKFPAFNQKFPNLFTASVSQNFSYLGTEKDFNFFVSVYRFLISWLGPQNIFSNNYINFARVFRQKNRFLRRAVS